MRKTFTCDETMIITIPIGNIRNAREAQLMPEKFHCVFKDFYKLFVVRGKPRPVGAAQAIAGVFIFTLGLIFSSNIIKIYTMPCVVYVICGMLSFAAGKYPNMHVVKLSFSLNIIGFFWSIAAFSFCVIDLNFHFPNKFFDGICGLIMLLLLIENLLSIFLIYWLSKAVCRQHFNTLPTILLKQAD